MQSTSSRYESLDILRGFCALSIMVYHYSGWTFGMYGASNVIGRFGVYGVSMFYVLSGLTMYLVYFKKFTFNIHFVKEFYTKRFFRIFPLMLFVLLVCYLLWGTANSWNEQILIGTGLFSILKWDANAPTGMWSIGNELAFYLMLPFIFLALKKGKTPAILVSMILFAVYFYFGYFVLNANGESPTETRDYKNPLNQAGLFLGGILIGHIFKEKMLSKTVIACCLLTGAGVFCFYPSTGELRNVYVGHERVIYTLICFVFTLGVFKTSLHGLPSWSKKWFVWLGEISYSLYLLHPQIFNAMAETGLKIRYVLPASVILTFVISWLVYKIIESPARNFGYKLIQRGIKHNKL